jgi:hypothetical protein
LFGKFLCIKFIYVHGDVCVSGYKYHAVTSF